jgi:hypothetical protein
MSERDDKRLERAEKKAAAANLECESLRREVAKLRHANYILQSNFANNPDNYHNRYDKLAECMQMIRQLAATEVNGLPVATPKSLQPWLGPSWARKHPNPEVGLEGATS